MGKKPGQTPDGTWKWKPIETRLGIARVYKLEEARKVRTEDGATTLMGRGNREQTAPVREGKTSKLGNSEANKETVGRQESLDVSHSPVEGGKLKVGKYVPRRGDRTSGTAVRVSATAGQFAERNRGSWKKRKTNRKRGILGLAL